MFSRNVKKRRGGFVVKLLYCEIWGSPGFTSLKVWTFSLNFRYKNSSIDVTNSIYPLIHSFRSLKTRQVHFPKWILYIVRSSASCLSFQYPVCPQGYQVTSHVFFLAF
jgi:hypothetical protein